MLKLLLCIFTLAATAGLLLGLRQQRLNLVYQTNQLHNRIEATQSRMWNQQLQIAVATSPDAVIATARQQNLKFANIGASSMFPSKSSDAATPPAPAAWIEDPNASK